MGNKMKEYWLTTSYVPGKGMQHSLLDPERVRLNLPPTTEQQRIAEAHAVGILTDNLLHKPRQLTTIVIRES